MNNSNNISTGTIVLAFLMGLYIGYEIHTPEAMIFFVPGVIGAVAFDYFKKKGR